MRNRFGIGRKQVQDECASAHLPRQVINDTAKQKLGDDKQPPPRFRDWADVVRNSFSEKTLLPISRKRETHCAICGNRWPD